MPATLQYPPKIDPKNPDHPLNATEMSKGLVAPTNEDAIAKAKSMMDAQGNSPVVSGPFIPTPTSKNIEQGGYRPIFQSSLPPAAQPAPAPTPAPTFKPVVPIPSAPANAQLPSVSAPDPAHPSKDLSDRFYHLTHTRYNPLSPADRDSMAQLQGNKEVPGFVQKENPSWDPTMSIDQWKRSQVASPVSSAVTAAKDALTPKIAGVPATQTSIPGGGVQISAPATGVPAAQRQIPGGGVQISTPATGSAAAAPQTAIPGGGVQISAPAGASVETNPQTVAAGATPTPRNGVYAPGVTQQALDMLKWRTAYGMTHGQSAEALKNQYLQGMQGLNEMQSALQQRDNANAARAGATYTNANPANVQATPESVATYLRGLEAQKQQKSDQAAAGGSANGLPSQKAFEAGASQLATDMANSPVRQAENDRWAQYDSKQKMERAMQAQPTGDPLRDSQIAKERADAAVAMAKTNGGSPEQYLPKEYGANATESAARLNDLARQHLKGDPMEEIVRNAIYANKGTGSYVVRNQNRNAGEQAATLAGIHRKSEQDTYAAEKMDLAKQRLEESSRIAQERLDMATQTAELRRENSDLRHEGQGKNYNRAVGENLLQSLSQEYRESMKDPIFSTDKAKVKAAREKISAARNALAKGEIFDEAAWDEAHPAPAESTSTLTPEEKKKKAAEIFGTK